MGFSIHQLLGYPWIPPAGNCQMLDLNHCGMKIEVSSTRKNAKKRQWKLIFFWGHPTCWEAQTQMVDAWCTENFRWQIQTDHIYFPTLDPSGIFPCYNLSVFECLRCNPTLSSCVENAGVAKCSESAATVPGSLVDHTARLGVLLGFDGYHCRIAAVKWKISAITMVIKHYITI